MLSCDPRLVLLMLMLMSILTYRTRYARVSQFSDPSAELLRGERCGREHHPRNRHDERHHRWLAGATIPLGMI